MENTNPKPKSQVRQLVDYIKKNLSKNYTLDSLRFSLMAQGYSRLSVNEAIDIANKELATEVPPIREKPEIIHRIMEDEATEEKPTGFKKFWRKMFG
jgi:hypothetical protein